MLALLLAHVVWGLARAALRTGPRRLADVAAFGARGDAAFLLADAGLEGAAAIERLRAATAPGQRIRWRGDDRGAIEFAAALLWPRLLVRDRADPGTPVLLAARDGLAVAPE